MNLTDISIMALTILNESSGSKATDEELIERALVFLATTCQFKHEDQIAFTNLLKKYT